VGQLAPKHARAENSVWETAWEVGRSLYSLRGVDEEKAYQLLGVWEREPLYEELIHFHFSRKGSTCCIMWTSEEDELCTEWCAPAGLAPRETLCGVPTAV